MSYMIEVLYAAPADSEREKKTTDALKPYGGVLTYREEPGEQCPPQTICLTFEFDSEQSAEDAALKLLSLGEFVEGPYDYGD